MLGRRILSLSEVTGNRKASVGPYSVVGGSHKETKVPGIIASPADILRRASRVPSPRTTFVGKR